jgi:UDP-N-acetylmuramoyl-L-alanyl-D-glutamate--2,6-diaminopimelate ligase
MLRFIKKLIPKRVFDTLSPVYHRLMVFFAALVYQFPSQKIFVVGVTGTKGKTTVLEIINAILEEAGHKTALVSTLRFKIGDESSRNKLKMTMPGRFFLQRFLRKAVRKKCGYVLMEMTSEGVLQSRHKFIELDAMIFTNLSPEHIESHGSFEKYRDAKLDFFRSLERSKKKKKFTIINNDDKNASYFLNFKSGEVRKYSINNLESYKLGENGIDFVIDGIKFHSKLLGEFNLYNILAAISFVCSQGIEWDVVKEALEKFPGISGRVEFINEGQSFKIVVDYAHTPDSLEKLYELFEGSRKICVLGAAGGGRDKWKRKELGKIAGQNCGEIILTNEDPYDENLMTIIKDVAKGIQSPFKYKIIPDRREAIYEALKIAKKNDVVLVTGKGTDPYIMGPNGTKIEWDDGRVIREELKKIKK